MTSASVETRDGTTWELDSLPLALWMDAVIDGGGTRRVEDSSVPVRGYVVGRPPHGDIMPDLTVDTEACDYIAKWIRGLPRDVRYVGIWRDSDTGLIHLDAVDIYPIRHEAHGAAHRRGELAYWSLHEQSETRLEV